MNKLADSLSPYLQQHANNPVAWIPWDEQVLITSKSLQKPILVSIGYSSCHWCHVMAHESFEDPVTSEIMNEHFICVKIDREERPDLDHYFMNAVQAMGISGGWPLHCFLTEDAKPFYGGTYFPPVAKYGRPSWSQVLISVSQAYKDKSRELFEQADHLVQHLANNQKIAVKPGTQDEIDPMVFVSVLQKSFDLVNGGFGSSPKFPHSTALNLLLYLDFRFQLKELSAHAFLTIRQMSLGGIYDQVGGGFSRYSVDGSWDVPHFEKMLYDHSQIIENLAYAYTLSKDPFYKWVADRAIEFYDRYLSSETGLYYAALDADVGGEEGKYYVWLVDEIASILSDRMEDFLKLFELKPLDQYHPDKKVIRLRPGPSYKSDWFDLLKQEKQSLNALNTVRSKRKFPSVDTKLIVAWNAMMVHSYVSWYRATGNSSHIKKAKKLLDELLLQAFDGDGHLCRYIGNGKAMGHGFLEDYAFMIRACLQVYQLSFEKNYLDSARTMLNTVLIEFSFDDHPLFKVASKAYADFPYDAVDWSESSYPSANAILCNAMRYFNALNFDEVLSQRLKAIFDVVRPVAEQFPLSMSYWVQELLEFESGGVILKTSDPEKAVELLMAYHIPGLMILPDETQQDGLVFCFKGQCHLPITAKDKIVSLFSSFKIE